MWFEERNGLKFCGRHTGSIWREITNPFGSVFGE